MTNKYTHCPGCGRHCPIDSLNCERGKRIVAALNKNENDDLGYRKLYDSIHEAEMAEKHCHHEHHCGGGHPSGAGCCGHGEHKRGRHRKGCPQNRMMHHTEPDENAPMQQKLLFKLHKCVHYLHSSAHGRAGQGRIISLLREHGEMTQRELTELAGVRSASISEVLSKLEHRGFIERTKNHDDRRNIDVHLTEAGKNAAGSKETDRRRNEEELFSCLTADEQNSLSDILDKLISHWSSKE